MAEKMSLKEKLDEKLANGEIEQEEYETLMAKFGEMNLLDASVDKQKQRSKQKTRFQGIGSSTIEGGDINEPIKVSGKLKSENSLKCESMKVSGSAYINGDLSVANDTKISGKLDVQGDGKFGGNFKLSGKSNFTGDAYFVQQTKISGKINASGNITVSEPLKISGKASAKNIKSTSSIKLSGKVNVAGDIIATIFKTSGGSSNVGGSIKAESVEIAKKWRDEFDDLDEDQFDIDEENVNVNDLGTLISGIVNAVVPKVMNRTNSNGPPSTFKIGDNIEAELIDISYTRVDGDLIGDHIKIGPGVVVNGEIRYRKTVEVPENHEYNIKQIDE